MNLGGTIHLNKKRCFLLALPVIILLYYIISKTGTIYKQTVVPQVNLKKLLEIAIKASLGGGIQVAKYSEHYTIENKGKTKEGANMSVTTADHESHCVMVETINNEFPIVSIVSEESSTVCNDKYVSNGEISEASMSILQDSWIDADSVNVWIDPLDATQEYTEKLFQYVTTMVCVSVNGEPVIGVVHFPFTNVTHWAWVGNGKSNTLNMKPKMVENKQERLKFTVSRSHKGNAEEQIKKTFKNREFEIDVAAGAGKKKSTHSASG